MFVSPKDGDGAELTFLDCWYVGGGLGLSNLQPDDSGSCLEGDKRQGYGF